MKPTTNDDGWVWFDCSHIYKESGGAGLLAIIVPNPNDNDDRNQVGRRSLAAEDRDNCWGNDDADEQTEESGRNQEEASFSSGVRV